MKCSAKDKGSSERKAQFAVKSSVFTRFPSVSILLRKAKMYQKSKIDTLFENAQSLQGHRDKKNPGVTKSKYVGSLKHKAVWREREVA